MVRIDDLRDYAPAPEAGRIGSSPRPWQQETAYNDLNS
jgi:hypothetical protein